MPPGGRDGKWVRRDSGPVVRPYAVTGGRTEPADGEVLDLVAVVVATGRDSEAGDDPIRQTPEHRKILACASSRSPWPISPRTRHCRLAWCASCSPT